MGHSLTQGEDRALRYQCQITEKTGLQSSWPAFAVIDFDSPLC